MATTASILKKSFKEANRDYVPVLKRGFIIFFLTALVLEAQHLLLLWYGKQLGTDWAEPLANFVASLLASSVYILVIPLFAYDVRHNKPETNFWKHSKDCMSAVIIEMLRVAGKVVVGIFVFVIPGIIWSVQLTFVPLIVQFDRNYMAGKVDALGYSEKLVKGRFFWIFALCVVFFLSGLLENVKFSFHPIAIEYWFFFVLNLFIQIYMYVIFMAIYEHLAAAVPSVDAPPSVG